VHVLRLPNDERHVERLDVPMVFVADRRLVRAGHLVYEVAVHNHRGVALGVHMGRRQD